MLLKSGFVFLACFGLMLTTGGDDDLSGIKCIVNGDHAATKDASAKHMDGEVYFCCEDCVKMFEEDSSKFEVKANHQMVLTGQYVQKGCPFSGNAPNEKFVTEVGGAEVGFCCSGCQSKVESEADVAAKANLVFTKAAFAKGFEKDNLKDVKCLFMKKKDALKEHAVDYREGKVYFCCKNCPKKFAKDTAKYAALANHQLVETGQFTQKACPISGRPVDEKQSVEVGGTNVTFCCGNCVKKVNDAADDAAKAELVFADKAFEKGFEKKK